MSSSLDPGLRQRVLADHDRLRALAADLPTLAARAASGERSASSVFCEALRYLGVLLEYHEACESSLRDDVERSDAWGFGRVKAILLDYADERQALSSLDALAVRWLATSKPAGLVLAAEQLARAIDADLRAEEEEIDAALEDRIVETD